MITSVNSDCNQLAAFTNMGRWITSDPMADRVNRIEELRKKARLTVQELADRAGISRNYLHELKTGKKRLNEDVMTSIARVLGCAPKDLLADGLQTEFDVIEIPVIAIVPGGSWMDAVDNVKEKILYVRREPGQYKGVVLVGNSMDKIARDGETVVVRMNDNDPSKLNGKPVIVECDGEVTCKIYRSNPDRFEPFSSDPTFQTIFPKAPCKIIGRVMDVYRPLPEQFR